MEPLDNQVKTCGLYDIDRNAEYDAVKISSAVKVAKKKIDKTAENTKRKMTIFNQSAAAGIGNYLFDNGNKDYETNEYDAGDIPAKADFGIRISGDSMEPEISNNQIVWVKEQLKVEDGDIGIFVLNNEALCKRLHINYDKRCVELISLNKSYGNIIVQEHDDLRTIGKVLA